MSRWASQFRSSSAHSGGRLPRFRQGNAGGDGFESMNSLVAPKASQVKRVIRMPEMSEGPPPVFSPGRRLLGREREREVLDRLLEAGRGGVLVMHGEAG